jgi:hypothetical protein
MAKVTAAELEGVVDCIECGCKYWEQVGNRAICTECSAEHNKDWTVAEVSELPSCNFCSKEAAYDTATNRASRAGTIWAYLCEEHYATESIGKLGLGLGQKLVVSN